MFICLAALVVILLHGISWLGQDELEWDDGRAEFLEIVGDLDGDWITDSELQLIERMLGEVAYPIARPHHMTMFGGQLQGPARNVLALGRNHFDPSSNPHYEVNLARVLLHEATHWDDLHSTEFQGLSQTPEADYTAHEIAQNLELERRAYKADYLLAERVNRSDHSYKMPDCAAYLADGMKARVDLTSDGFGYGRALMSVISAIDTMSLKNDAKWSLTQNVILLHSQLYPFADRSIRYPIDCLYKWGYQPDAHPK